jgi:hypothetical protein
MKTHLDVDDDDENDDDLALGNENNSKTEKFK